MNTCTLTVTLANNKRVIDGLTGIEDQLLAENIWDVIPWTIKSDAIQATIEDADFGRYDAEGYKYCLLYTSPSPRDGLLSRMPCSG